MIRGRLDKFIEMFGYKPIIGMVHLPPLPGSPLYEGGGINSIIDYALEEATILEQEGVNGIEIEKGSLSIVGVGIFSECPPINFLTLYDNICNYWLQ